jgi:hypothetical protein
VTSTVRGLIALCAAKAGEPAPPGFHGAVAPLSARFGAALAAVLLYGSCRRQRDAADGVVDLYVIVDDYAAAYRHRGLAWANAVLPPNVFYLETPDVNPPLRVKYAVLSRREFRRLIERAFQSYFWARFAQPVTLIHARDPVIRDEVAAGLAAAVLRFLRETTPLLGAAPVDAAGLWAAGFRLSYGAELRPETAGRAALLVQHDPAWFHAALEAALPMVPDLSRAGAGYRSIAPAARVRAYRRAWRLRRVQGVFLSVLRLAKAALTFSGGVDYAAWKVERHTGVHVDVTPRLRRFPLLFGWRVLWQLLRRGALR